jgi:hypothetical protein
MSEHSDVSESGGIEKTLSGGSQLSVGAVVTEAWQLTDGVKALLFGGWVAFLGATTIMLTVFSQIFGLDYLDGTQSRLAQIVVTVLLYPFVTGVLMIGLKHSVGIAVDHREYFAHYGRILTIAAVGLLQSLVIGFGLLLLILPGLYLSIALLLAIPLHVEKRLGIVDSLVMSLKLVNKQFLNVTLLLLLVSFVMIVSVFTIIGPIWSIPWTIMVISVIYRDLAGVEFNSQ